MNHDIAKAFLGSIIVRSAVSQAVARNNLKAFFESKAAYPDNSIETFHWACNYALKFFAEQAGAPSLALLELEIVSRQAKIKAIGHDSTANIVNQVKAQGAYKDKDFLHLLRAVQEDIQAAQISAMTHKLTTDHDDGANERAIRTIKDTLRTIERQDRDFAKTVVHADTKLLEEDFERYIAARSTIHQVSGFFELDRHLRGFRPGELVLAYGSAGDGKSTLVEHMAVINAYACNKDVIFVSLEMGYDKVRDDLSIILANQILALPESFGFPGFGSGQISATELAAGNLSPEAERFFFHEVIPFLDGKTNKGSIRIISPSHSLDPIDLTVRLDYELDEKPADLIIIDYIALLDPMPGMAGLDWYSALGQNIKEIKRYALRKGIPIISPHQVNRQGREKAEQTDRNNEKKGYGLFVGSSSSEAEKSADIVISIFRDDEHKEAGTAMLSCLKNRRGPEIPQFEVTFVPEYKFFNEISEVDICVPPGQLVEIDL